MRVRNISIYPQKWLLLFVFFYVHATGSHADDELPAPSAFNSSQSAGILPDQPTLDFISFVGFQLFLSLSNSEFDLKEPGVHTAAIDNLIFANMLEMESNVRQVLPKVLPGEQLSEVVSPGLFLTASLSRMALRPPKQGAMTPLDISTFWGLRAGVRGAGQLMSRGAYYMAGIDDPNKVPELNYALSLGMCLPASAMATLSPGFSTPTITSNLFCAQAASQFQGARVGSLIRQNYTENEALTRCSAENLALGLSLVSLSSASPLGLASLVLGAEITKSGCDCTLKVLKNKYLPEKGIQRTVAAFTFEGVVFLIHAVSIAKTQNIVFRVYLVKMRNGAMFHFGTRFSQYAIPFFGAVLMTVFHLMMQLSPYQ